MAKTKGTFVVPRNFDHEGKRFATKVNESIAQLKGELGDPLDGAVTFRDLIDAGIAKRDIRIGSNGQIVGINSKDVTFGDEEVLGIPPAPTGVSVDGAFQNIIIEWDVPTFYGFSHAEVWAASTSSFADRVFVGQTTAAVFNHQVGTGQTRYYWIRFVNIQDTVGPFNSTTGTSGTTALIDTQDIADQLIEADKILDGAITEVKIASQAVSNAKIKIGAIQENVIAAAAISADKIASDAITAVKIATGAVEEAKIATSAVSSGKIATGAVIATKISSNAVTSDKIAANSVTAAKIVGGTITSAEIASGTITAGNIASNTITAANIAAGAITASELATNSVTAVKIQADAVTSDKIAANSVTAAKMVAGTITAASGIIGDLAISSAKIIDGAILNAKIGNAAVDSAKIASAAIVEAKIADAAITNAKIANASISTAKIQDAAINNAKINDLDAGKINAGTLSADRIGASTITADKINVTDLALEFTAATVSGTTIGYWNNNTMRLKKVADIGTAPGIYHIFCRVFGGTGQVKTLSVVAGDGTFGGSGNELRNDIAYSDALFATDLPIADQGYAQFNSGQAQTWSGIDRFDSTYKMVQKDFIVRKVSSSSRTLSLYILAQGDGSFRYLSNVQYGVYKFSEI